MAIHSIDAINEHAVVIQIDRIILAHDTRANAVDNPRGSSAPLKESSVFIGALPRSPCAPLAILTAFVSSLHWHRVDWGACEEVLHTSLRSVTATLVIARLSIPAYASP